MSTEQKHTPGPWQVFSVGTTTLISQQIDSEGRFAHASVLFPTFHPCGLAAARAEQEANAARIVACVNFLEGIPTQAIVNDGSIDGMLAYALETERDLRAEVERLKLSLRSAVDYVVRKESHKGTMDAEQLAAAENEFRRTLGSVGTGRWAGDTIYFDLHAAQKLIDGK